MKNNKLFSLFTVLVVLSAGFIACSRDDVAGTATDTENTVAIAGVVKTSGGVAARRASVQMISGASKFGGKPVVQEAVTDSVGAFVFDTVAVDTFNLLVQLEDSSEIAFEASVSSDRLGEKFEISVDKPAIVSGTFNYADYLEEVTIGSGFKLSVLGTGIEQSVLAGDTFAFALPAGNFKLAFSPNDEAVVQKLRDLDYPDSLIYLQISAELASNDTLHLGDVRWVMGEKPVNAWKDSSRISGYVVNSKKKAVAGAAVRLVTDIYGFEFAAGVTTSTAENLVYTDSNGYWSLPFPTQVLYDSLRVEATAADDYIAVSRFIKVSELKKNEGKNISLDSLKLAKTASLNLEVRLVINKEDSTQTDNCLMNGIIVGLVGTDRFTRIVTCDQAFLSGLPVDEHPLVYYTSDMAVLSALWERDAKPESYLTFVRFVGLAPNDTLERQIVTYTPPTL